MKEIQKYIIKEKIDKINKLMDEIDRMDCKKSFTIQEPKMVGDSHKVKVILYEEL